MHDRVNPEKTENQKARRAIFLLYALIVLFLALPAVLYVVLSRE